MTLVGAALPGQGWGAENHSGSIESVSLTKEGGFVRNEASFRDVGAGSSKIAVWIEVYEGSGGPLRSKLSRKSAKTACQAGRTCLTLLRTVVQVLPGECYVGKASTTSAQGSSEKQSPATGRLCP
jgi:hypothetical protein